MTTRRKRLLRYLGIPLAVLAILALAAWIELARIDAAAEQFAETGKAALALLGCCGSAAEKLDVDAFLESYALDYTNDREGDWTEQLRSSRDGVKVYEWSDTSPRPFTRSDVAERLTRFFTTDGQ